MRPIYWGLVLTFAGIGSLALLGLVAVYERLVETFQPIIINGMGYEIVTRPMPAYYIALIYVARFAMLFSLPLASAIEARHYLKERKAKSE